MPKIRVYIDFSTDDITSSTGQQLISHVLNFGFNPEYHVSLDLLFQYRWIWSFRDSLLCLAFILITVFCIIIHKHIPQRIYWQHNSNNKILSSPWNYELSGVTLQGLGKESLSRACKVERQVSIQNPFWHSADSQMLHFWSSLPIL